ncbi:hypothetical protein Q3G72_019123 [Acer saccharum]|nr:hypothetical protein Q3G72_019123 [Acer saccharum]
MNSEEITEMCALMSLQYLEGCAEEDLACENGVEIEVVTCNVFAFHFKSQEDRRQIWVGGPLTFDDDLIVLEKHTCKGEISMLAFNRVEFWV